MIRLAILGLILATSMSTPASAQVRKVANELEKAKALWLGRDYPRAYGALLAIRAKPYGRRVEVDFMLATSACQLGHRPYALKVLTNILSRYSLGARAQQGVRQQIENCAPNRATIVLIQPAVPTTSGGWGKTYFWLDNRFPVASYPARRTRELAPEIFAARMFRRDAPLATDAFKGEGCSVTVGAFVILCSKSEVISLARQKEIVAEADAFVGFLDQQYGIEPADEYVTIRLVPDVTGVRTNADRLHGLDISKATIAYSFQDDLSLVAVSSGKSGSILHELVHLALRRDFGDAPQWFEEGMASLYEVSFSCEDLFYGVDNWRGDLLRRGDWEDQPSAYKVIDQKWFELAEQGYGADEIPVTPTMGSETERATAEAKMRYIAFYLQEQNKLKLLYDGLKASPVDGDLEAHQKATFMEVMGARYDELEETLHDFTFRKGTSELPNLSESCRRTGTSIQKDFPKPPSAEF